MPGMLWSAAPSHRLKKRSKPCWIRRVICSTAVDFLRHSTCHWASGKKGRGSHGQSSATKGSARRSWLVRRQMRIDGLPSFNYAHLPLAEEEAGLCTRARDAEGKDRAPLTTRTA